jgi:hypothetical protein
VKAPALAAHDVVAREQDVDVGAALSGPDGRPIRFGFTEFLPAGVMSFCLILTVSLGWAVVAT